MAGLPGVAEVTGHCHDTGDAEMVEVAPILHSLCVPTSSHWNRMSRPPNLSTLVLVLTLVITSRVISPTIDDLMHT